MSQYYSDPSRENDTYALPDVEVFYAKAGEWRTCNQCGGSDETCQDHDEHGNAAGFYFWFCFPGCMPEGEANGPYETEAAAVKAMRAECE